MNIISKKDAKAAGLTRFFTGRPCKNGHLAERHISSNECLVCVRNRLRHWRKTKPQQFKIYEQRRDRERTNILARARYQTSRKKRISNALWRKAHRDSANSTAKKSYRANLERSRREQRVKGSRRRARLEAVESTLTRAEFDAIVKLQRNRCAIDGAQFTDRNFPTIDHIIPLSKGGPTTARNTQAVCLRCNRQKRDHLMEDYMRATHGRLL